MTHSRRQVLGMMAAGAGLAAPRVPRALAQAGRSLHFQLQGFSLAIHMPELIALRDELPKLGYGAIKVDRIESMQVITQSIVAGSAEIGDADVVSTLRASEAGADVRLIGLVYNSTSQVLVVNADKIKCYADFKNPANAIALNSRGDFIYVILSGILARHDIDLNDTTIVEIGRLGLAHAGAARRPRRRGPGAFRPGRGDRQAGQLQGPDRAVAGRSSTWLFAGVAGAGQVGSTSRRISAPPST